LLLAQRRRLDAEELQRLTMARLAQRGFFPHCQSTGRRKHGIEFGAQRFRRKDSGKTCTSCTGTPLQRLRDKTKLHKSAACMADGLGLRKTAERMDISLQIAFAVATSFWLSSISMVLVENHGTQADIDPALERATAAALSQTTQRPNSKFSVW